MNSTERKGYKAIMKEIDALIAKGGGNVLKKDLARYRELAIQAQKMEQATLEIKPPESIEGILELVMYKKRLKQKDLAGILDISEAKLSLIISGKQRPDVKVLKNIHEKLGVDGNMLLEAV